jgi:single-strand DNA-binding protein
MNKVFLVGRLTRDPELRYTSSNLATMRCAIAVDRQFAREGEERGADFINIVAFGNRAETMSKYLTKGSQIAVDGRIQTGSYDGADGKKVYTTDVVVENFQFLDTKGSRNMENVDIPTDNDIPNDDTTDSSDPFADFGAKIEVSDSELPF